MSEFTVTQAMLDRVMDIAGPRLVALNRALTKAFPDDPDIAFALALGRGAYVMQGAADDPALTAAAFNLVARPKGYVLVPVS